MLRNILPIKHNFEAINEFVLERKIFTFIADVNIKVIIQPYENSQ